MNVQKRKQITVLWVLVALGCVIIFSILALNIHSAWVTSFDHTLILAIQGMESPWLTELMFMFTWIGNTKQVIAIAIFTMVILYFILKHRMELWMFVITCGGSALLNVFLKTRFLRDRPTYHRLIEETGYSFPSGHSMAAFTLYCSIAFLLWKHMSNTLSRVLTILLSSFFIVAIGVSRIYLGVHFPSDVIGAYFISGCWVSLCIATYQYVLEYRISPKPQSAT